MRCPHCDSDQTARRRRRTTLGYRTFSCHACRRAFNERSGTPFNHLQYPTDIVRLAVLWRLRYKLSFRDVAELLLDRGFDVTLRQYLRVRRRWHRDPSLAEQRAIFIDRWRTLVEGSAAA